MFEVPSQNESLRVAVVYRVNFVFKKGFSAEPDWSEKKDDWDKTAKGVDDLEDEPGWRWD